MLKISLIFITLFVTLVISAPPNVDLDQIDNVWDLVAGPDEDFDETDAVPASDVSIINYTTKILEKHGYFYEEHEITTPDGYLLTLYRIIGGPVVGPGAGKKVALLQHGVLSSSADWILTGPGTSFAYRLCDEGYDVWLANSRGNTYGRKHLYLSPNKRQFWDFSWHEIGQIDLPAIIDYVLSVSGQKKLHVVAHSQGTTAFFVMGALRPDMMSKVISMQALAPVAFMKNIKSPFLRAVAPFTNSIDWLISMLGIHEFFPSNAMMRKGGSIVCKNESPFQELCKNALFLIGGYNSEQFNKTLLPEILQYVPAGSSRHQLVHFAQGINSGKFRMFDFGMFGNLKRYGSMSPPSYDLSKVTAPVALHYGDNDWLSDSKDVAKLADSLPNLIGKFRVGDPKCNHFDFIWGIDADKLLHGRLLSLMQRYE